MARLATLGWFTGTLLVGAALLAKHVLYAECRCSQRIAKHLLSSVRPEHWQELVLWTGDPAPPAALSEHYRVQRVTAADLTQLGIAAAPLLVLLDPQDRVAYVGGYSDRKQGPELDDPRILAATRRGEAVTAHPVFGCAVSEQLKRQLSLSTGL